MEAKPSVQVIAAAILRPAALLLDPFAMIAMMVAVEAANLQPPTSFVVRAPATAILKRHVQATLRTALRMSQLQTATDAVMAFSVPLGSVPLAMCSAKLSWALTHRAMIHMPVTRIAVRYRVHLPSLDETATAWNKTSSTARSAKETADAVTVVVRGHLSVVRFARGSTVTNPLSLVWLLVLEVYSFS